MTFEEFKELALNPPYIDQKSVYRVDVHCYVKSSEERWVHETQFEVRRNQSFVFSDLSSAQCKLKQIVGDEELKDKLYAVYIYQLPIGKDISNDLFQRLWVYDRFGNLNGQSPYTTIIEDLDHPSAEFRGYEAELICFNRGDIVEVYDREIGMVYLATIVCRPMTIEQCWKESEFGEMSCTSDGLGAEATDSYYWLFSDSDCYLVSNSPESENSRLNPCIYDVFAPSISISSDIRHRFDDYYHIAIERIHKKMGRLRKCIFDKIDRFIEAESKGKCDISENV